jgi:hypothetical protein
MLQNDTSMMKLVALVVIVSCMQMCSAGEKNRKWYYIMAYLNTCVDTHTHTHTHTRARTRTRTRTPVKHTSLDYQ